MTSLGVPKKTGITGLPLGVEFSLLALVSTGLLWLVRAKLTFDPISYTAHFADEEAHFGIPNFLNVITNLGFLLFSGFGFRKLAAVPDSLRSIAVVFLLAVMGTAFGSAYFHWETSPQTLFWDQLPMSIGFGSFVGLVIADRVDLRLGRGLAVFFCVLGAWTVWSIYYAGGSTTPYLALQFGSLILSTLLLLVLPRGDLKRGPVFLGIAIYVLAKIFEHFDVLIFEYFRFISGHSLKHIAATFALMAIFRGMQRERLTP